MLRVTFTVIPAASNASRQAAMEADVGDSGPWPKSTEKTPVVGDRVAVV